MLHIRYHPQFKFHDTLLFDGTRDDIALLRSFFLHWNGEKRDMVKDLQAQEPVHLLSVVSFDVQRSNADNVVWNGDHGTWFISPAYQQEIVGLLDALLKVNREGHQYLESANSPIQIMVSKGENYPIPT